MAGRPSDHIQYIDVRDAARFMIDTRERSILGTFNVVTPPGQFAMGDLIAACLGSAGRAAHPAPAPTATWIPSVFLAMHAWHKTAVPRRHVAAS